MREPILLPQLCRDPHLVFREYCRATGNTTCFYEQRLGGNNIYYALVEMDNRMDIWSYGKLNKRCWYSGQTVTLEGLLDALKTDYPDEFEWFLWNQDLL